MPGIPLWLSEEEGFTFIEVITALALMGILLVVIWGVSSNTIGSLARLTSRIMTNVEQVRLDAVLRDEIGRVETPYWTESPKIEETKNGLHIYYLDGNPKKYVGLSFNKQALAVSADGVAHLFRGIAAAAISEHRAAASHGDYVSVVVRFDDGEQMKLEVPFGGFPFPVIQ